MSNLYSTNAKIQSFLPLNVHIILKTTLIIKNNELLSIDN